MRHSTLAASPPVLRVAAALLAVEALVAVLLGGLELGHIRAGRAVVGAGAGVLLIGYGALLLVTAWGVVRGRRWARGPGVATSLLQLPLAWGFRGGTTSWVTVALAAVSLLVLVCLLSPTATRIFTPGRLDQADG